MGSSIDELFNMHNRDTKSKDYESSLILAKANSNKQGRTSNQAVTNNALGMIQSKDIKGESNASHGDGNFIYDFTSDAKAQKPMKRNRPSEGSNYSMQNTQNRS